MPGHLPSSVAIGLIPECVRRLRAPILNEGLRAYTVETNRRVSVKIVSCVDALSEPAVELLGRYPDFPSEAFLQELLALASLAVPVFQNHVESAIAMIAKGRIISTTKPAGSCTLTHRETVKAGLLLLEAIPELAREASLLARGAPVVQKSFRHSTDITVHERRVKGIAEDVRRVVESLVEG